MPQTKSTSASSIVIAILALIFFAAFAATAQAQQFEHIDPLVFTKPFAGANPLPQILHVASTGSAFTFTAAATTSTGGSWLSVSPSGFCCTTPSPVSVIVNAPVNLSAGTYSGQVTLTSGAAPTLTIPVTLIIAAAGSTFFDNMPGQVNFSAKTGSTSFTSQQLQVRNGGPGTLNWTLAGSTFNGGNWLTVSSNSGTAPAFVTVGIVPQNLPNGGVVAGVYTGQLLFQQSGGGSMITVPVAVTLGDNVFKQINALSFSKPFGGADPLPQTLAVASTGAAFTFTATAVSATGGDWLQVSPSGFCCTTPATVTVSAKPSVTLAAGTYTAQVEFYNATNAIVVPVTLTVAAAGTSFLDNMAGQLSFSLKTGSSSTPPAQLLQVRNGGSGNLDWTLAASTFDNGTWLSASPGNGTTPSQVSVQIQVANLPGGGLVAGVFTGQLLFRSAGGSVTVPIAVTVGDNVFEQINGLGFTKVFGGADPLPQTIIGASTGTAFTFTAVAYSATGGDWLTVTPSGFCCTTPRPVTVSVNPSVTLAAGTYTGQVVLYNASTSVTVPVTLTVAPSGGTFFDNMPGQLGFAIKTAAGAPPGQLIQIRNEGSGTLSWTAAASTADGGNWLTISAASGIAPSQITVGIVPQNLPGGGLVAGTFSGQVLFQGAGQSITVPVTLTVGGNVFAQINGLSFAKPFSGANPLPQIITATSLGTAFTFTATATTATGGNWLTVSPSGFCCTTPRTLTVSVNPSVTLAAGTYTGQILLINASNAITVPVTLTVSPIGGAFFDNLQGQMSFSSLAGGATLTSQPIQVRNAGGGNLVWTLAASTFDNGNWLTVSSTSGTAPSTINVGVTTANLPGQGLIAGVYTGELLFQSADSSITVPVSVEIGPNVFVQQPGLAFTKAFGSGSPLPQSFTVSSSGTNFTYTATSSSGNGGSWFAISPSGFCCTTPKSMTATATSAASMPAGTYTAQAVFDRNSSAMTVPITLTISTVFSLNPTSAK